jgi:hypothetical protein
METVVQTAAPARWVVYIVDGVNLILWAGVIYIGVQLIRVLHRLLRKL